MRRMRRKRRRRSSIPECVHDAFAHHTGAHGSAEEKVRDVSTKDITVY
jgi:hypothetical protein